MFDNIFTSIITNGTFSSNEFMVTTIMAFICGLIIAGTYMIGFNRRHIGYDQLDLTDGRFVT